MQQYDKSKKKQNISLIFRYVIMTIAVAIISVICIFLALGYRFDFSSKRVEQGALIQMGTVPDQANITLDGEQLSFKTNGKREVETGVHDLVYHKDKYRDWTKRFTLKAGEVRWLNYARLIPTTVETTAVKEVGALSSQLPSPDRTKFAIVAAADVSHITIANVSDANRPTLTSLTLPTEAIAKEGDAHTLRLVEWNLGSKYLLARHDSSVAHEYIRLNTTDQKDVVNISSKFGVAITELHFSSESVFYGIENSNLRKFDLNASTMSEPLVKNIVSMKLYGSNDLGYVRHENVRYEAGVYIDGKARVVSTYDDTTPLHIDMSKYFNERYLAITRGASFELIKNPEKTADSGMKKVVTLSYPSNLEWLDISPNGRFAIAGTGAQFFTYDVELAVKTEVNFPSLLADATIKPQWLDDFTLVSTGDNKLRLSDFDGTNQQIVSDALPAQPVMLTADGKLLYSFSKNSAGSVVLQVSKMTVN